LDAKYQLTSPPARRDASDWLYIDTEVLTVDEVASLVVTSLGLA
jgi:hypothetical protein